MIGGMSPPFLPLLCGIPGTILLGYFWRGGAARTVLNRHLSQFRRSSTVSRAPPPWGGLLPLRRGPSPCSVAPPTAVWPPPKHSASCWRMTSTPSALAWRSAGGKTLNQPQVQASFLLRPLVLYMLGAGTLSHGLFRRPPASPASLCAMPHAGGGGQEEAPLGGLSSAHPSLPSSSKFSSLEPCLLILKSIIWKKGKKTPAEY